MQAQLLAEHQIAHKAVQNAGNARQRFGGEFDHTDQLFIGSILVQIHCGPHADGQHDQQREQDHVQCVKQKRQNALCALGYAGHAGDQLPADGRQALDHHIANDAHQHGQTQRGGQIYRPCEQHSGDTAFLSHRRGLPSAPDSARR